MVKYQYDIEGSELNYHGISSHTDTSFTVRVCNTHFLYLDTRLWNEESHSCAREHFFKQQCVVVRKAIKMSIR